MKEYEYSIKVKNLAPYIDYCEKNGYKMTKTSKQIRVIYRNKNKTMARITYNEIDGVLTKQLDFKEDNLTGEALKVLKESQSLDFDDEQAVLSILEFLEYEKDNTLIRTRMVFEKGEVKFEIDDYEQPYKSLVVAIEGEKEAVDIVFNEICKLN